MLEAVLVAVDAAGHSYIEVRCNGARWWDLIGCGETGRPAVLGFFRRRGPFKTPFELRVKDVGAAPRKDVQNFNWSGESA